MYPYKFRHTQASLLYAAGVNPVTISNRLGHSEVSTTQDIYSHLLKDSDRKAGDAISKMLYKDKKKPCNLLFTGLLSNRG